MASQQLLFDIFARSQGVEQTFDSIVSSADSMESKLGPAGQKAAKALSSPILLGGAAAIGGAVVGMGIQFGQMAASAEQNAGAVATVFGTAAGDVESYASRSADAVGLSSSAYNELSAVTGTALKAAGVSTDELAAKNDELITRGADLASVFGGTTTEAVGAMGAAFRGEFDSLERYGLTITAAAVEAELAARGQDKLGGAALEAAKKQATMDLIMQQSAGSAGNFAREADTAAGAQERQAAAFADAGAKLGEALLPGMTMLASVAADVAGWISQNAGLVTALGIGLGILAGVVGILSAAVTVMNIVMAVNPIALIVIGVVALIAALALLIANWDAVVAWISGVWGGFVGWLTGVTNGFIGWWNGVWAGFAAWISGVWNGFIAGIRGLWSGFVSWIIAMVVAFVGTWNAYWSQVGALISSIWNGFISGIRGLWSGFIGWITGVIAGFVGAWNGAWSSVGSFFAGIWRNIVDGASRSVSNLVSFFTSLPGKILGAVSGASSWLLDTGRNLIQGLINGVLGMAGRIRDAVASVIGNVVDFAKDILGIASPSKVFTVIGQQTGEGYAVGLASMGSRVDDRMAALLAPPPAPVMGSAGGAAGSSTGVGSRGNSGGEVYNFNGPMYGSAEHIVDEIQKRKRRANVLAGTRRIMVEV